MLNPAIGELIEKYESRYQLVLEVAKEAREIAETAEANEEILLEKPVSLAIDKLNAATDEVEVEAEVEVEEAAEEE